MNLKLASKQSKEPKNSKTWNLASASNLQIALKFSLIVLISLIYGHNYGH